MPKQISMVSLLQPVRKNLMMFEPLNSLVSFINLTFSHQAKNNTNLRFMYNFLKKGVYPKNHIVSYYNATTTTWTIR